MCEIDFVLLGPRGIFFFEIKGGRIKCQDGIWYYIDRFGDQHKSSEGPFNQVKKAMFDLQKMIKEKKIDMEKLSIGYGVIFPDCKFTEISPEWPVESICDVTFAKEEDSFKKYLNRLIDYWTNKKNKKALADDDPLLSKLTDFFRPNFDHSVSLQSSLEQIESEIIKHTEEQYKYIDCIDNNERIICTGGAGTGKSFLAVETTRRELFKKNSVILLVMEDIFRTYLKKQLESELDNEKNRLCICSLSDLKLIISNEAKFDVLIVDEGQDLMSASNLDNLDLVLKNGLSNGKWRYFMDPNKQANVVANFDDDSYEILKSFDSTKFNLRQNCRNTKQIVRQAEQYTGAKIGDTLAKNSGVNVIHCDVIDNEDELKKINMILFKWLEIEGISLSDIVILSPLTLSNSIISRLDKKWKKRITEINTNNVMSSNGKILFSMIKDFKGLESKCIILVDAEEIIELTNSKALLYVALTRARSYLWIAESKKFKEYLIQNLEDSL